MIKSFRNKGLQLFWEEGNARRLAVRHTDRVHAILIALNVATHPGDMDQPGYRFHPIPRIERGRYAVLVSGNYRITFGFAGADAVEVDLEDYH